MFSAGTIAKNVLEMEKIKWLSDEVCSPTTISGNVDAILDANDDGVDFESCVNWPTNCETNGFVLDLEEDREKIVTHVQVLIWAADNGKKSFDPFSNWREQGTVAYDKLLNTPITFSLYSLILLGFGSGLETQGTT